jgi:hypothetical protein
MKGVLFILMLLALLFGGYLVYRNLSEQTSTQDGITHIEAIERGRRGAQTVQDVQDEVHRRAQQAGE